MEETVLAMEKMEELVIIKVFPLSLTPIVNKEDDDMIIVHLVHTGLNYQWFHRQVL